MSFHSAQQKLKPAWMAAALKQSPGIPSFPPHGQSIYPQRRTGKAGLARCGWLLGRGGLGFCPVLALSVPQASGMTDTEAAQGRSRWEKGG